MTAVAPKTYQSDKLSLSVVLAVDGKSDTVNFERGFFTTDDLHEQNAIEASSLFKTGHVRIAPTPLSPREALLAKKSAAENAAMDAAAELAAYDKVNAKPAPAKTEKKADAAV